MEPFKFEVVYEALTSPLDNQPVPTNPFGPILVKVLLEDDGIFILGTLQPDAIKTYFTSDEGAEHLAFLIDQMLSKQAEAFCIVKVYECYTDAERTDRGIAISVHHQTGVRMGCLPIDAERISHHAPMLAENVEFVAVKIPQEPLH